MKFHMLIGLYLIFYVMKIKSFRFILMKYFLSIFCKHCQTTLEIIFQKNTLLVLGDLCLFRNISYLPGFQLFSGSNNRVVFLVANEKRTKWDWQMLSTEEFSGGPRHSPQLFLAGPSSLKHTLTKYVINGWHNIMQA